MDTTIFLLVLTIALASITGCAAPNGDGATTDAELGSVTSRLTEEGTEQQDNSGYGAPPSKKGSESREDFGDFGGDGSSGSSGTNPPPEDVAPAGSGGKGSNGPVGSSSGGAGGSNAPAQPTPSPVESADPGTINENLNKAAECRRDPACLARSQKRDEASLPTPPPPPTTPPPPPTDDEKIPRTDAERERERQQEIQDDLQKLLDILRQQQQQNGNW